MKRPTFSRQRAIFLFILLLGLAGVVLVILDWEEMVQVLARADWKPIPGAILFTIISYTCVSFAFSFVARMMGIKQISYRDLAQICFITTVLNHVLTSGGVVGYSVRYFLMRMYGVRMKDVLAASILHFYLTSLDMLGMLPFAFIYLLLNASVSRGVAVILGGMTLIGALIFITATALVFAPKKRGPLLKLVIKAARKIFRKNIRDSIHRFDETLTLGAAAMRARPVELFLVLGLTAIDFAASIIVLGFCFDAFGSPVRAGILISGYVIGVMAGVLSMVPGGLGVQEGSMAGIYLLLGIPFSQAVLAAILFRAIYYLLPYFISLIFYERLSRKAEQQANLNPTGDTAT